MSLKQSTYLIGTLIIGISILISSFVIASTSNTENLQSFSSSTPDLMTKKQLSEYLQINEGSVEKIIKQDDFEKTNLGIYDTYQFIPYLIIDNQERFLKTEIDEWLQYKNEHH